MPLPVRARSINAPRIPMTAFMPVPWSIGENGLRTGGPPGSPVIDNIPVNDCAIRSKPL